MKNVFMPRISLIILSGLLLISLIGCGAGIEAEKQYAEQVMEICLSYGLYDISVDLEWEGKENSNGKKSYDLIISCSGFENIEIENLKQFANDIAAVGWGNTATMTAGFPVVNCGNNQYTFTVGTLYKNGEAIALPSEPVVVDKFETHGQEQPDISISMGEKNALQSAKDYLNYLGGFSYEGLIEQLGFEGYTHSEAVYAADNCGADWNEQAAIAARQYLNTLSFSRQGLIEQLEFEGFTHSQAVYGVEQNGY